MSQPIDFGGNDLVCDSIRIGASSPGQAGTTLTGSEVTVLDSVTAGTVTASKAVVVDASKNIGTFGTVGAAATTITSASASALSVGLTGATNSAFKVDSSTASQVAGLKVTGAATGGTVAVVCTDSGSDTNLTVNAKGAGTIGIGSVSTGAVTITPNTTITGTLTQTGVATFNANPTFGTGNTLKANSGTLTLSSNAATATKYANQITTESLSTAGGASQACTITFTSNFAATDLAFVTLAGGTNTTKNITLSAVMTSNTCTVTIYNNTAATALNGTVIFNLWVVKA